MPGAGHVLFEGAAANLKPKSALKVDFQNDRRAPLVFIAIGIDHVGSPSVIKSNVKHYRKSASVTEYKEFAGPCPRMGHERRTEPRSDTHHKRQRQARCANAKQCARCSVKVRRTGASHG